MIMYIQLYDLSMKIHLNTAENYISGLIEKINDFVVLILIYIIILFTDLARTQEDKYLIGWVFVGILAVLILGNISLMGTLGTIRAQKSCKLCIYRKMNRSELRR